MRIGLAQIPIVFEDKPANRQTCRTYCDRAADAGVEFLIFPEMTLTGFSMHTERTGETGENAPTAEFFREQARQHHLNICFGYVDVSGEKAKNRCLIVDRQGEIIARYDKIHPFSYGLEAQFFQGGEALSFCRIGTETVCPTICYDLRFPELYQAASKKARLITVIANWPTVRRDHWVLLLRARAVENQCFIAAVNAAGTIKKQAYPGDSALIDPYGRLVTPESHEPELLVGDADFSLVDRYRQDFPLKNDRREDIYRRLYGWRD